jgi:hypothetical protein
VALDCFATLAMTVNKPRRYFVAAL